MFGLPSVLPWYLKPKNLVLMLLGAAVVTLGTGYLLKGTTIAKQDTIITEKQAKIDEVTTQNKQLILQVEAANKNMADIKRLVKANQKLADDASVLLAQINNSKSKVLIGGEDGKILCEIVDYFNSGGVLRVADGDPKAGGQVLSSSGKANACSPIWTAEQIEKNFLAIVKYSLGWEKLGACYEQTNY